MTFSDRIERICREHNEIRALRYSSKDSLDRYALGREEQAINFCLGTLGISCVRKDGYITAFEYIGGFHEVRS